MRITVFVIIGGLLAKVEHSQIDRMILCNATTDYRTATKMPTRFRTLHGFP
jgi:hypothetical protein